MSRVLCAWDMDESVVIGCVLLLAAYLIVNRKDHARTAYGIAGIVIMFLALVSPIDTMADTYLFSAHMLQHMLLVLVVPPLLLLGISRSFEASVINVPALGKLERLLARPLIAFALGMGTLCLWHLPPLYDGALANEWIHILEHLCFLATATIFWWPLLTTIEDRRMAPHLAILYLVGAMLVQSFLGIAITFAPLGVYTAYLHPADPLHILSMLRNSWGMTPAADQELGGLFMWVPGGLVFLAAILMTMFRWYRIPGTGSALPTAAF
jgi:cytochrome c oxidase assembly factor CtaG